MDLCLGTVSFGDNFFDRQSIDEMALVARSKTVVDIHHRDPGGTAVEHTEERRKPPKACAITDAGRDADYRAGNQPADHTGECAFHARHNDCHIGLEEVFARVEQTMNPGHTDVIDPTNLAAKHLGGNGSFFGNGQIGGPGADHRDVAQSAQREAV